VDTLLGGFWALRDTFERPTLTDTSSSDAEAEVLADYVIALVTANEPDATIKANCLESLVDFLEDSTWSGEMQVEVGCGSGANERQIRRTLWMILLRR
jgi:hypothetical protein